VDNPHPAARSRIIAPSAPPIIPAILGTDILLEGKGLGGDVEVTVAVIAYVVVIIDVWPLAIVVIIV
jgi:hypothetical protein